MTEITLLLKSLEILHRIAVKYAKQRVHDHYLRKHGSSTDTDQEPLEVKHNTGFAVVHMCIIFYLLTKLTLYPTNGLILTS